MPRRIGSRLARLAALGLALPALGGCAVVEAVRGTEEQRRPEVAVHGGVWDLNNDEAGEIGVQYDLAPLWEDLRPTLGLLTTTNGAWFAASGFAYNLHLGDRVRLTGHTAAGLYAKGRGSDLGGPIEFRSGLDLDVRVLRDHWIGVGFAHTSNAVLYASNPGSEAVYVQWTLALPGCRPESRARLGRGGR